MEGRAGLEIGDWRSEISEGNGGALVAHLGAFAVYKRLGVWHSMGSDQSGSDLFRARGLCPWPLLFLLGLQPREDVDQGFVAPVDEGFQPRDALLVE